MKKLSEQRELERKRRFTDSLNKFVRSHCEEIPPPTAEEMVTKYRGRVVHVAYYHDDNCPAHGTGIGCICTPLVKHYLQPLKLPTEH